jgi:cytochrome c
MTHKLVLAFAMLAALPAASAQAQNAPRGAQVFRACAACHSLEPGRHMTGPSLAEVFGRKAGSLPDFPRYSRALKNSGLVWDDATLDPWIADPQHVVPGTFMVFPGVKDAQARAALIAYLKTADTKAQPAPSMSGMGMGGPPERHDLKKLGPDAQLTSIRYCGDTYFVTAASGKTEPMWENNLRFKTDSSDIGPKKGHPVLMPAGMMGDRASAIFADPSEISSFIEHKC